MTLIYNIIISFCLLWTSGSVDTTTHTDYDHATEPELEWITLKEAQDRATVDGKPLLIFVEAEWCGTCKEMKSSVFPEPVIRELLQGYHLVTVDLDSRESIQLNGESLTERDFARSMNVQQTPTTVFIDSGGEVMGRQPGFMNAEEFAKLLHYVRSDQFGKVPLDEFEVN